MKLALLGGSFLSALLMIGQPYLLLAADTIKSSICVEPAGPDESSEVILSIIEIRKYLDIFCDQLACLANPESCATCDQFNDLFVVLNQKIDLLIKVVLKQNSQIYIKFLNLENNIGEQENSVCTQIADIETTLIAQAEESLTQFSQFTVQAQKNSDQLVVKIQQMGNTIANDLQLTIDRLKKIVTSESDELDKHIVGAGYEIVEIISAMSDQIDDLRKQLTVVPHASFSDLQVSLVTDLCLWCKSLSDLGAKLINKFATDSGDLSVQLTLANDAFTVKVADFGLFLLNKNSQLLLQIESLRAASKNAQLLLSNQLVTSGSAINNQALSSFTAINGDFEQVVDDIRFHLITLCTSLNSKLDQKSNAIEVSLTRWLEDFCAQLVCLNRAICTTLVTQFTNAQSCLGVRLDRVSLKIEEIYDTFCVQKENVLDEIAILGAFVEQQICTKISALELEQSVKSDQFSNQFVCFQAHLVSQICSKLSSLDLHLVGKADEILSKLLASSLRIEQKINEGFEEVDCNFVQSTDKLCEQIIAVGADLESRVVVDVSQLGKELKQQAHDLCVKVVKTDVALSSQIDSSTQTVLDTLQEDGQELCTQIENIETAADVAYSKLCLSIKTVQDDIIQDIENIAGDLNARLDDVDAVVQGIAMKLVTIFFTTLLKIAGV